MTETGRPLALALALSLAGSAALAQGDVPSAEGEPACSALCRSWMNIGRAEPPAPSAAAGSALAPAAAAPSAAPPSKARAAVQPRTRTADRPRRAVLAAVVPLPAPRPAPDVTRRAVPQRLAVAEGPPSPARPVIDAPHVLQVAATEGPMPVVDPAKPAAEAASVAPPAVAPSPAETTMIATGTVAPSPIAAYPSPPDRTRDEAAASAPVAGPPPATGTPWSVRLCLYAVLAALAGWGFRPRRPIGSEPEAEPVALRRASARFDESGAQHAAVDAL